MVEYRIEWEYLLIGYKGHGDWFHSRDKCLLETNIKIFNDNEGSCRRRSLIRSNITTVSLTE